VALGRNYWWRLGKPVLLEVVKLAIWEGSLAAGGGWASRVLLGGERTSYLYNKDYTTTTIKVKFQQVVFAYILSKISYLLQLETTFFKEI